MHCGHHVQHRTPPVETNVNATNVFLLPQQQSFFLLSLRLEHLLSLSMSMHLHRKREVLEVLNNRVHAQIKTIIDKEAPLEHSKIDIEQLIGEIDPITIVTISPKHNLQSHTIVTMAKHNSFSNHFKGVTIFSCNDLHDFSTQLLLYTCTSIPAVGLLFVSVVYHDKTVILNRNLFSGVTQEI